MTKYLVKWKSPPYGLTGGIDKQYDSEEQALEVCQFLQKVSELYVAPGLRKTFYVEPDMIKKEEV